MGSSASKPVKSAASAAARRQYPKKPSSATSSRPPPHPQASPSQGPQAEKTKSQSQGQGQGQEQAGPAYHSKEQASASKSEAIDLDARDPDFAASLRSIGPVVPNPTLSNSSAFNPSTAPSSDTAQPAQPSATTPTEDISKNPALLTLASRDSLARAAEKEFESIGRTSHAGREFLDPMTIKQILGMRDRQGMAPEVIERQMRLKEGVVARLGPRGVSADVR